ncbi:hypothetical protein IV38_GL001423 [Lactobacillus selangorensis]|uniref:Uncharacterized protein n=1 Tax=Lactobacillus selangorensis TaxID=81857 RepID=A0A0R2FSM5_9LACO|nr:hypothetical protein [Lactobacillus selangorensis]KRN28423.1 hypothetical protein IV38_GL001423 [Lactobacillus selangorensis]KRN31924.1 hypothetical protein IV40_GL001210 [Lactobacillus selangorensis]
MAAAAPQRGYLDDSDQLVSGCCCFVLFIKGRHLSRHLSAIFSDTLTVIFDGMLTDTVQ